jgi:hypothetical protein
MYRIRSGMAICLILTGIALLGACADAPSLLPVPHYDQAQLDAVQMRAVLVAGEAGLPAFDNAAAAISVWLRDQAGVTPDRITRLSASPAIAAQEGIETTTWSDVIQAIEHLKPAPGQGCFVFMTSHGIPGAGIELASNSVLSPDQFDKALVRGCGNAPTVVVISACFSGSFAAPPMTRANRIVITAARADRTSFGCHAGATYTFFDECLLGSLRQGGSWNGLFVASAACVRERERLGSYIPSEPQEWLGSTVADMPLPKELTGGR